MTKAEAIEIIKKEYLCVNRNCDIERSCGKCDLVMPDKEPILEAYKMAIKALSTIDDIKAEIKDLHNSHMINFVSADGAVDTCIEIIDKHIGKEGAE